MSTEKPENPRPKARWLGLAIWQFIASVLDGLKTLVQSARIFQQNGRLVRAVQFGSTARIEPLNLDSLTFELDRVLDITHRCEKRNGDMMNFEPFPRREYILSLLNAGGWPAEAIPVISGVRTMPFFTPSGAYVDAQGYNSETGLYLVPAKWITFKLKPDLEMTPELSQCCLNVIEDIIQDFPFVTLADKANAYAMLITPFARELFTGPSPLFYVGAGKQGTGKDLLVDALTIPFLGRPVDTLPPTKSEEEQRKRITSILISAVPVIRIGNQTSLLASASLAASLTSATWSDRVLGSSVMCQCENKLTAILTGNNLEFDADMVRRMCPIRIEAECERPEERSGFKHDPLLEYCTAKAGHVAGSVLTMIRIWISQGRPLAKVKMGSFQPWAEVVGGILEANGIPHFLENLAEHKVISEDESESEKCQIIEDWFSRNYCEVVQARDLLRTIEANTLPNLLTAATPSGISKQFGKVIKGMAGTVYRGMLVVSAGADNSRVKKYRLSTKPQAIDFWDYDVTERVVKKIREETGSIECNAVLNVLFPTEEDVEPIIEKLNARIVELGIPLNPPSWRDLEDLL